MASGGAPRHGRPGTAAWVVVAVAVAAATVPRLVINYGSDGDAWRGAAAAMRLWQEGRYVPSRLPGNPLFEYALAVLVPWGGHVAANAAVLAFFAASIAAFARVARKNGCPGGWIAIFALTPILLVNAATSLDYVPGLAMLLWAWAMARDDRWPAAGVLVAAAIGLRLSNMLFVLPLGVYALRKGRRPAVASVWGAAVLLAGLAFYVPILRGAGSAMFRLPPSHMSPVQYAAKTGYNVISVLGPAAAAAIGVLLIVRRKDLARSLRAGPAGVVGAECAAIAVFVALFLLHSDEAAYLLPVLPFVYLRMGRCLNRREMLLVGLLIVADGIVTVNLKGGESGRRRVGFQPAWGQVVGDGLVRRNMERIRTRIGEFRPPGKAVIITAMGPILTFQNDAIVTADPEDISSSLSAAATPALRQMHRVRGSDVFLVYALRKEDVLALRREGWRVYMFDTDAPSSALRIYGYDPRQLGVELLPVFGHGTSAFPGSP